MNTKTNKGVNETMELARNYLETRYEDSFTPVRFSGESWAYNYSTVVFASEKYGQEVEVRVKQIEDEPHFADNYFRLLFEKDAETAMNAASGGMFTPRIQFPGYMTSDDIFGAESFSQYVDNGLTVDVYFLTKKDFGDSEVAAVTDKLTRIGFTGIADFILVRDDNGEPSLEETPISKICAEYLARSTQVRMDRGRIK